MRLRVVDGPRHTSANNDLEYRRPRARRRSSRSGRSRVVWVCARWPSSAATFPIGSAQNILALLYPAATKDSYAAFLVRGREGTRLSLSRATPGYGFANFFLLFFKIGGSEYTSSPRPRRTSPPVLSAGHCRSCQLVCCGVLAPLRVRFGAVLHGTSGFQPKIDLQALPQSWPRTHAQFHLSRARSSLNPIQTSITVSSAPNFPRAVVPRA